MYGPASRYLVIQELGQTAITDTAWTLSLYSSRMRCLDRLGVAAPLPIGDPGALEAGPAPLSPHPKPGRRPNLEASKHRWAEDAITIRDPFLVTQRVERSHDLFGGFLGPNSVVIRSLDPRVTG